jgi:hypothetical protein
MKNMEVWPTLQSKSGTETYATLHMWTQIVGKICLALTPRTNHFWNIALQVTPRGLSTPLMYYQDRTFTITFDFISHQLLIQCADGKMETIPLRAQTVADFFRLVMSALSRMNVEARIWTTPVEIPDPIPFEKDTMHKSYDPAVANAFWHALVSIKPVFEKFRSEFIGKCSPVHFFWGSFDLAVTRFSGRRAPDRPGADSITRESYSHEVISHGFWPGSGAVAEPAFYAYSAPEPPGFKNAAVRPSAAYYSTDFSDFILPYESVRAAASPEEDLTAFMKSTYTAAADSAHWDRAELERIAS